MQKAYLADLKKYVETNFINWNKFSNKTILLSGATGLIGRYFVDLIMYANLHNNLNCKIIGLSTSIKHAKMAFPNYFGNKFFNYIAQDVCMSIECPEHVDFIVHCASNTSPTQYAEFPIETINTNVLGTKNLLDFAVKTKATKFVLTSSFEVYGNTNNESPISEHDFGKIDCTILRSCYPESKRLSENLCVAYSQEKGIDTSIARLSRVFGPTMNPNSTLSLSQFIKCGLAKTDITLKSDGHQKYSYNYVGDAVTAILKILTDGQSGEAYNVADESFNAELGEFAKIVASHIDKKIIYDTPTALEAKGFSNSTMTILDGSKLKALGWTTPSNLSSRIIDTLQILSATNG